MEFTPIDFQKWPRGQMYYYFSKIAPTGYSISVTVDVTKMRSVLKAENIKFFPAYLWIVTKALNRQIEFKIAEKDGQLGYYDTLTPLYATFHEDDKTISLMWTEYHDDFSVFYQNYMENKIQYGRNHGLLSQAEMLPPENSYTVSCIPWIAFEHFAVHSYENKPYYFPSVEAGKFYKYNERTLMPLSITCHHATTDGYHVYRFLDELQAIVNEVSSQSIH